MGRLALILLLCALIAFAVHPQSCVNPEDTAKLVNKHVCIDVHVYDVVELADGTRFLDVCARIRRMRNAASQLSACGWIARKWARCGSFATRMWM